VFCHGAAGVVRNHQQEVELINQPLLNADSTPSPSLGAAAERMPFRDVVPKLRGLAMNRVGPLGFLAQETIRLFCLRKGVPIFADAARCFELFTRNDPGISQEFWDGLPPYLRERVHHYRHNFCRLHAMEQKPVMLALASAGFPGSAPGCVAEPLADLMIQKALPPSIGQGSQKPWVDLGCGVGWLTSAIRRQLESVRVVGVDISPRFLVLAQAEDPEVHWRQGDAQATGLEAESAAFVSLAFVVHETPASVTQALAREAFRLLQPGGALVLVEMNPAILRSVPRFLFAVAQSIAGEPFIHEYRDLDMKASLRDVGFGSIDMDFVSVPRHVIVTARKPDGT
jgi:SAM-dependent methyltransferase